MLIRIEQQYAIELSEVGFSYRNGARGVYRAHNLTVAIFFGL